MKRRKANSRTEKICPMYLPRRVRVAGALIFRARNAPARKEINDLPGSENCRGRSRCEAEKNASAAETKSDQSQSVSIERRRSAEG